MSQIFKSPAGGPSPPTVATSYVTDDGTAIPALNVLNVLAVDSIENNANGVLTRANPNLSNNLYAVLTNRISVSATTSDGGGQTQDVTLMTMEDDTSISFYALVTGYDSANDICDGGEQIGIARKSTGNNAVVVGTNDTFVESDPALAATDWVVMNNGADLIIRFTGVAAHSIAWRALFEYTQAP